jgi:3-hydroxybutyryl-CoA dehydrogenase
MKSIEEIKSFGIAGAGVMGHGITLVAAQSGYPVILYDTSAEALTKAQETLEKFTAASVAKGKLDESARQKQLSQIQYTTKLDLLIADCIIEAIPERLDWKQELFRIVEANNTPDTLLATNTSALSVTEIANCLQLPERFLGLHFFNPAPLMKLVEVIGGEATSTEVLALSQTLVQRLGKVPAIVADTPGFIVNRIARFYYLEGLRMTEEQAATPQAVDRIMEATGFRMGPFRLMDLIGVETNHSVTKTMYAAFFEEPRFRPSRLQQKKVEAKHFGQKTGRGFYEYP